MDCEDWRESAALCLSLSDETKNTMKAIREFEKVVFTVDLPEYHVAAGDVGTVVEIIREGVAYEVEVFFLDGQTLDVVGVEAGQIRPVTDLDVMHARPLSPEEAATLE